MSEARVADLDELRALLGRLTNYERLPDFHAGRVRVDLGRMEEYVRRLGHPERAAPVVHVTGTKGKGSTATMTARLLGAHGLVVGLHTSPHLERMEERVQVDAAPIDGAALLGATNAILEAAPEASEEAFPTFFEWVTLVAFLHFRARGVDVAIHEVGLGGRLDATNVVRPSVTVVTNVGLEHARILGGSVEEIAIEKAGIVKPGAPLLTAVPADHVAGPVLARAAAAAGVPLLRLGADFDVHVRDTSADGLEVDVELRGGRLDRVRTRLLGGHQAENLGLALAATEELLREHGRDLDDAAVRETLAGLTLPGRLEVVAREPTVVVDGAHTPDSVAAALGAVQRAFDPERTVVVLAMAADKDLDGAAQALRGVDRVLVTRYDHPRAASPEDLAERVRAAGGVAELFPEPQKALARARILAERRGVVLVVGSLYLVEPAKRGLSASGDPEWNTSRTSS